MGKIIHTVEIIRGKMLCLNNFRFFFATIIKNKEAL